MADENMNTIHITEKQKVQEITDKLEEGLKELFESEKYKTYLSTMSKFHNYSFNNTLLIAMQKPEATLVAGYKAWQKNCKYVIICTLPLKKTCRPSGRHILFLLFGSKSFR